MKIYRIEDFGSKYYFIGKDIEIYDDAIIFISLTKTKNSYEEHEKIKIVNPVNIVIREINPLKEEG